MPSKHFKGLGTTILGIHQEEAQAEFRPLTGYPQPLNVIFDKQYNELQLKHNTPKQGVTIGGGKPTAWFKTGIIHPEVKDELCIGSQIYIIREIKSDGLELTELSLSEKI